ncbi:MAG: Plant protein of unknown function (DUF641) [Rhodobacteraceae bacterium HLUCCA08]|nr:MAG: Plant protein of unknown function (DUF641) [Rhodobacteraceae bacterium HLUCCA08]
MTDQPGTLQTILMDRLAVTQKLSAATAEHLRLSQAICGMEVLEMGEIEQADADMQRQRSAVAECEATIAALERDMAKLDQELDALTRGDAT